MLKSIRDFKRAIQAQRIFCFAGVFCLIFCFSLPVYSRTQSQAPHVSQILIDVDDQSNIENIEDLLSIKEGEAFSLKKVNSSIKQIYKTGLFSDVRVKKDGDQDITLTFQLIKRLFTRNMNFTGAEGLSQISLKRNLVSLQKGEYYSEEKLVRAKEEVKQFLENEGYFLPVIEASVNETANNS